MRPLLGLVYTVNTAAEWGMLITCNSMCIYIRYTLAIYALALVSELTRHTIRLNIERS